MGGHGFSEGKRGWRGEEVPRAGHDLWSLYPAILKDLKVVVGGGRMDKQRSTRVESEHDS